MIRAEKCPRLFPMWLHASHWLHFLLKKDPVGIPPTKQLTFVLWRGLKGVSGALGAEQNLTGGDSTSYLLNSSTPQDPRREGQFQQRSFSSKNWKCCVGGYQGQYLAAAFPCFKYYNSSSETFCKSQNMWISSKKFLLKFSHSQQSSVRKCTLFSEVLQYSREEF